MTGSPFDEYVAARSSMLLRFAYLLCGDAHLAEDLVQEVLVRAHRRWSAIEAENPDAYLKRALVRTHVSWRRRRASTEVVTSTFRDVAALDAFDDEHASREEVWALLAMLPPRQRAVLVLRYFEDLDDRRIAELVGSSAGAVRVHAHRGLTALRETLVQRADEAPSGAALPAAVRLAAIRATRRRRALAAGGIAVVAALVALALVPLLHRAPRPAPVGPTPSPTAPATPSSSPTVASDLVLAPMTVTPPVFPYTFGNVPIGAGPTFVGMFQGLPSVHYGDGDFEDGYDTLAVSISAFSVTQNGNAGQSTVVSQITVNGIPATLQVTPNPAGGGPFVQLEWQRDGLWFWAETDGTFTADEVHAMAESMALGTMTSTRTGGSAQIARIALPSGYAVDGWTMDSICAHPQTGPTRFDEQICISVPMGGGTDLGIGDNLSLDGLPACVCTAQGVPGLVVVQPDGRIVQVTYATAAEVPLADLVALYHGVSLIPA